MQKYVDLQSLGTKLQIISVFSVEHVKGFIYIEADKQCDINEVSSLSISLSLSHTHTKSKKTHIAILCYWRNCWFDIISTHVADSVLSGLIWIYSILTSGMQRSLYYIHKPSGTSYKKWSYPFALYTKQMQWKFWGHMGPHEEWEIQGGPSSGTIFPDWPC